MRRVALLSAIAVAIACGSTQGSGNTSPSQVTLQIVTSGNGLVRGAGQDCRGSCSMQMAKGTQVRLLAVADSGAIFSGWTGACSGAAGSCDLTLNGDTSVAGTFAPAGSHRLTVTIDGTGRVSSAPAGIDCAAGTCSAVFTDGTQVSLTAGPGAGASFSGWGGGCSGGGGCAMTVASDVTVFAHFDSQPPTPVTLTVSVSGPGQVTGGGISCGNGATTCQATVQRGTRISLAVAAAAQARFTGWAGACGGAGSCEVTLAADTSVRATFDWLLQTLVPNDGTAVFVLAINSASVFYGRQLSDGSSIWSVPKAGGTPTRIASGFAATIVADDAFVYWTDRAGIYSAPVGGGTASLLASSDVGKLALDADGSLWWIEIRRSNKVGAVHRMQSRVDRIIVANSAANYGVAVDDVYVYFTVSQQDLQSGYVMRARKDGSGTVATIGTSDREPLLVRADANNVYFRTWMGGVYAISKASGDSRRLSTGNTDSGNVSTVDLDVNASAAYWNWFDGTSAPRGIFKANSDGTSWGAVDSGDGQWFGPRVDDSALYYWHSGSLLKRLK